MLEVLHLANEPFDFGPPWGTQILRFEEMLPESRDGTFRIAHALIAAPDVAQIRRVKRLRVKGGVDLDRLLIPPRREGSDRLRLPLVVSPRPSTLGDAR